MTGLVIESVAPGSAAQRAGLLPGERLLAIDGQRLRDLIDYSWLASDHETELTVCDRSGTQRTVWLEPEPDAPLGLTFAPPEPKRCGNNCLFCFVHQLPKGLRRPLYVKDEDYRLSFLQGTYVTLTNLKETELRRIIRLRLSPLYISVHATEPALREQLLGKSGIPPILEQLTRLAAGRIQMHTQIVLCPGLNDGPALERTVSDLAALYPAVQSLAVVPVGLTSHRQRLPRLNPVDSAYAATFLTEWLPRLRALNKRLRTPFLQLADEFFLKAGHPFPGLKEYGDLPQWENGVGMVPWFQSQAAAVIKRAKPLPRTLRATVITGRSAAGFVTDFIAALAEKTGAQLTVRTIPNRLFGESVTVTGLISGKDIISALKDQELGELVLVPGVMLKEGEGCFLDNLTPADVSQALGLPVISFDATPADLYTTLRRYAARRITATNQTTRRRKP
jgi:putative radical SAM enzyme (TIGR03279 family)